MLNVLIVFAGLVIMVTALAAEVVGLSRSENFTFGQLLLASAGVFICLTGFVSASDSKRNTNSPATVLSNS